MRYLDYLNEESCGIWFFTFEGFISTAITTVFLLIITRIFQKPPAEDTSWGDLIAEAYAISLFGGMVTIFPMAAFSIPFDWFIPSYCIVFWIGYGLFLLHNKWEEKQKAKDPPRPPHPAQTLPPKKDGEIQYCIKKPI